MRKGKNGILIVHWIFEGVLVALLSFGIGESWGRRQAEKERDYGITFYAVIEKLEDEHNFLVRGLEVNDINHQGLYYISVTDQTNISDRYIGDCLLSDLRSGMIVSITYEGGVDEIYPVPLNDVKRIVLLQDPNHVSTQRDPLTRGPLYNGGLQNT